MLSWVWTPRSPGCSIRDADCISVLREQQRRRDQGEPLDDVGAYIVLLRGVNMWRVQKWDGEKLVGKDHVLKDLYVDEDVLGETAIQQAILAKLECLDLSSSQTGTPSSYASQAKGYLFNILAEHTGVLGQNQGFTPAPPAEYRHTRSFMTRICSSQHARPGFELH